MSKINDCKDLVRKLGTGKRKSVFLTFPDGLRLRNGEVLECADIDDDGDLYVILKDTAKEKIYEFELPDKELGLIIEALKRKQLKSNKS